MTTMEMSPLNPPTRYVRKPRNTEQKVSGTSNLNCEAAARPVDWCVKAKTDMNVLLYKSKYNRLIGEMIRQEMECEFDDLAIMDHAAYFEAMRLNLPKKK